MAKITKSGKTKISRKHRDTKKLLQRRRHRRGGASKKEKKGNFKPIGGIMYWIKNLIATKVSYILNGQITRRLQDHFLSKIPPQAKIIEDRLREKIDDVSDKIVSDMTMKGLSVAENGVKAVPGIGNALSVFVMVDKAVAGMRNVATAVNKIAQDVENAKMEMTRLGVPQELIDQLPTMPNAPTSIDDVLPASAMEQLNKLPGLGSGDVNNIPAIPTGSPISMTTMPNMLRLPQASNIQVPQMPSAPQVPNMQSIQNQMTQDINNKVNNLGQKGGKKPKHQRYRILARTDHTIKRFQQSQLGGGSTRRILRF
jgi:hypothetical protein